MSKIIVKMKQGLGLSSVVEFLPGMQETLGSIPSTVKQSTKGEMGDLYDFLNTLPNA